MNELHDPYCPHANPDSYERYGTGRCMCRLLDYARRDEREIAVAIINSYIESFKNGFSYDQWEIMVQNVLAGEDYDE